MDANRIQALTARGPVRIKYVTLTNRTMVPYRWVRIARRWVRISRTDAAQLFSLGRAVRA